jgi:hypothetical protein
MTPRRQPSKRERIAMPEKRCLSQLDEMGI